MLATYDFALHGFHSLWQGHPAHDISIPPGHSFLQVLEEILGVWMMLDSVLGLDVGYNLKHVLHKGLLKEVYASIQCHALSNDAAALPVNHNVGGYFS